MGNFVYYAVGYAAEYFIWDVRPVGRHEIDRGDGADGYKLIICAAVSHYADCLYAGQYGEELAHLVRIAAFVHFVAQHRVRVLQYAHLLGRDFAYYTHAEAGTGERLPPHKLMRNAQHFAHAAHFILEKILQRLYRAKELYIVRLLDLVMMRLYNGGVALAAFYAVGVYRSLCKEAVAIAFAYLVPEYAVKLVPIILRFCSGSLTPFKQS